MTYTINFTDRNNKTPITVYDNTYNTDTSIVFPGRNVSGYGQAIAENLLALLENFSSSTPPPNPVEGQIWFNNQEGVSSLLVWDGNSWKSASGIYKSPIPPSVESAKVGELWVDTVNNQVHMFSGTNWILVGPEFSSGLKSGLTIEKIVDTGDFSRVVLVFYVENLPIAIISKDGFTPKVAIPQFPVITPGVNLATPTPGSQSEFLAYVGGVPGFSGTAAVASNLLVNDKQIPSTKFARIDVANVFEYPITIKNDSGVSVGSNGNFSVSTSSTAVKLYSRIPGTSIDFQVIDRGVPSATLRVVNNQVGINTLKPTAELDVTGTTKLNGKVVVSDQTSASEAGEGALVISGGVVVGKNLIVSGNFSTTQSITTTNVLPLAANVGNIGSSTQKWNKVYATEIVAETISGVLTGSISGNANTASSLQQTTEFSLVGDVSSSVVQYNGQTGGLVKQFETEINTNFISRKADVKTTSEPYSKSSDELLIYRKSSGALLKVDRDTLVGDLGVPTGAIMPFCGTVVPAGYLLCDGSEISVTKYAELYALIGNTYNGTTPLVGQNTFRLPDLRGRFALGRDNMANNLTTVSASGNVVPAGGGAANRVSGNDSKVIGGSGGSDQYSLSVANLPDHEHTMRGSAGQQYYAMRTDPSVPADSGAMLSAGGTQANQAQYLPSSGRVKTTGDLGRPYGVINPFLTVNYIIRAGKVE